MQNLPPLPFTPAPVPWHREPWPWLLMLGPAVVIVAGVITTVMAFRGADGLIAEDYYKQGLAINRMLAREQRAAALGVKAQLAYAREAGKLRAQVSSAAALPALLTLRLAHPTRAGEDQVLLLRQVASGSYEAAASLPPGRWRVVLESPEWRLAGPWQGGEPVLLEGGKSID